MPEQLGFTMPPVDDDDVRWVSRVLDLPSDAFTGPGGNDPRLGILRDNGTLDVEACPGSGKTTILVAKLAILARKWTDPHRGLCVLSHTNVARREIEARLGGTMEGQRLLSYPHFIGTIHGFVGEFLAIPWLRSRSYPITAINDDVALAYRWGKLPVSTRKALENKYHGRGILRVSATDFDFGNISWGKGGTLGKSKPTYLAIQSACRQSCEAGYFCYDEMFVWARELIAQVQDVVLAIRTRFPVLFIDEVQDNSETQSGLLHQLFIQGDNPSIRQRYGDANQAIYQRAGQTEGASTDPFPGGQIRKDIPNSHRFGQEIADLANPLALEPQSLLGSGPRRTVIKADTCGKNAVFLFKDTTITNVLPSYAHYLQQVFSSGDLQTGVYTAIGAVHRSDDEDKVPRSVRHYWPEYDHELTVAEPRPSTFHQYIQTGRRLARESGEAHGLVDKTAEGILRLGSMIDPASVTDRRIRKHRHVLELLTEKPALRTRYLDLVTALALDDEGHFEDEWQTRWSIEVRAIAEGIASHPADAVTITGFLKWPEPASGEEAPRPRHRDNIFRYPTVDPRVQIRVGSIHSAKGETHTATLVLDTYFRRHHLSTLKPWLLGEKSGKGKEGPENASRLKQHYVAMTRPSHLLCLAMREDAFDETELEQLKGTRWRVARITDAEVEWL